MVDVSNYLTVEALVNVLAVLVLVAFGAIITYAKYSKNTTNVATACKYFAMVVSTLEGVPSVSPTVLSWCRDVLKAICTGTALPEPLPTPANVDPAGVTWIFSGTNKVALLDEKVWRAGGGKIVVTEDQDAPDRFSWAYMDTNRVTHDVYVHYDQQGYYDLEDNTIYARVANPFDYETPPA